MSNFVRIKKVTSMWSTLIVWSNSNTKTTKIIVINKDENEERKNVLRHNMKYVYLFMDLQAWEWNKFWLWFGNYGLFSNENKLQILMKEQQK